MPSQASHCFAFEQDFVGSWRCIPLCVRRKLDLIGLKLKLSHWLELSHGERQTLVDWPDDPEALERFRAHLQQRTRSLSAGEAKPLPASSGEPWQLPEVLPEDVAAAARARAQAISPEQWKRLGELERFALCKLTRPGHDHHNLEAALRETLDNTAS
ncbi:nitrate reductase associated protein [Vulcanococcus sp.]|jgi:hypothetical protein|uniref:nitrate reductase associated protein n=1 Tax=Vulcanococcus sp. TaxID=2856995 RepID=UPI003C009D92